MSIGLLINYRHPRKEDRLVPIASDYIFSTHWKPICEELHLRWVPRFQNGWTLSAHDIPYILTELAQLRRYLTCGETHAEISHHLLARISVLMRELNEVHKNMDADAFVGSSSPAQRRALIYDQADTAARRRVSVRPSIRAAYPLISHSMVMDPEAVSQKLLAALESAAPANRSVDPLPGTVCRADVLPILPRVPWAEKIRWFFSRVFGLSSHPVPRAWRTTLELK